MDCRSTFQWTGDRRTWTDPSTDLDGPLYLRTTDDLDGPLYGPGPDPVEAELNLGGEGATPEFPAPDWA